MMTQKTLEHVIIERQDKVATAILNEPEKRNFLMPDMCRDLVAAYEELWNDDSIVIVITTGAGDVAWCAGRSSQSLVAGGEARRAQAGLETQHTQPARAGGGGYNEFQVIRNFPKVTEQALRQVALLA